MPAPKDVLALVEKFDRHRESYESAAYNETQLRREFLDPMFAAMGWDVQNVDGTAEAYKEVIHEDAIKVGEYTKAPDYAFRIGGTRKFFVEAKKPAKKLKDDAEAAFQLRRYAWSAKLPLSILTDFQEFAVYDTRLKPSPKDKASVGRVLYFTHAEYAEKWEEIAGIFSRQAVLQGAFDRFAEAKRPKRGSLPVDEAFLKEIEGWREALAKNIAVRNQKLDVREINFAVQRIIDRIIFLRIAEDRGIERYGQLQGLSNGKNVYARLFELFERADDRYNSGLFHFKEEKGRAERPDELTPRLKVDDDALQDIIGDLYLPKSPYAFSVISADILGAVYEQFLGKVIRLTAGHHVKVEEKPEVRKAGGVYYTPTYIVDYIVKQTVGKLLEGKTPKRAAELKVLDPACGSGSFLIGAYQHLLDWHRDWYGRDGVEKHRKVLYQGMGGVWRLTTKERTRILLNSIYGVDIDTQAVEVTKLSLLLKVLEGGSPDVLQREFWAAHERVLPDLGNNIKCGNSLIGPEFLRQEEMALLDGTTSRRVNVFDWKREFPPVFDGSDGGFDAIIGNPPYIRIQALNEWYPEEAEFYKSQYSSGSSGNFDIYVLFVERGLQLLSARGRLGFILPHKFFNAQYGESLRGIVGKGRHLAHVVHFGDQQVFTGATTYTALLFLTKVPNASASVAKVDDLSAWRNQGQAEEGVISAELVTSAKWHLVVGRGASLFERLSAMPTKLEDVTDRIFQGLKTSADKIFIVEEKERQRGRVKVYSPEKDDEYWLEPDLLHPLIKGGDSKRYRLARTNRLILFPYERGRNGAVLIPSDRMQAAYPQTWAYLKDNKTYLEDRERGLLKGAGWYGFGRTQALDVMPLPKIFTPDIALRPSYALDVRGDLFFTGGVAGGYGILVASGFNREYILGLLNSRLLDWCIRQSATQMRGGYYSYESRFIRRLPIRVASSSDRKAAAAQDRVAAMVGRMLELHRGLADVDLSHERTVIERKIDASDREIDESVYELYGLTDDEIGIVEAATP